MTIISCFLNWWPIVSSYHGTFMSPFLLLWGPMFTIQKPLFVGAIFSFLLWWQCEWSRLTFIVRLACTMYEEWFSRWLVTFDWQKQRFSSTWTDWSVCSTLLLLNILCMVFISVVMQNWNGCSGRTVSFWAILSQLSLGNNFLEWCFPGAQISSKRTYGITWNVDFTFVRIIVSGIDVSTRWKSWIKVNWTKRARLWT